MPARSARMLRRPAPLLIVGAVSTAISALLSPLPLSISALRSSRSSRPATLHPSSSAQAALPSIWHLSGRPLIPPPSLGQPQQVLHPARTRRAGGAACRHSLALVRSAASHQKTHASNPCSPSARAMQQSVSRINGLSPRSAAHMFSQAAEAARVGWPSELEFGRRLNAAGQPAAASRPSVSANINSHASAPQVSCGPGCGTARTAATLVWQATCWLQGS